jgi:Domain of unknown function (DUF4177)
LSRATQAAKGGFEKTRQASAEHSAAKAADVEAQAAAAAAARRALADLGHQFMEYRVVALRETMVGDKIDTGKLQATLNEWGRQGWHVRAITAASVGGRVGPGGVGVLIITFERPLPY